MSKLKQYIGLLLADLEGRPEQQREDVIRNIKRELDMEGLEGYTVEELEQEIEDRLLPMPVMLEDVDITKLREYVKECIEYIHEHGYTPKDMFHYLGEGALELFYGKNIWGWYNDKLD